MKANQIKIWLAQLRTVMGLPYKRIFLDDGWRTGFCHPQGKTGNNNWKEKDEHRSNTAGGTIRQVSKTSFVKEKTGIRELVFINYRVAMLDKTGEPFKDTKGIRYYISPRKFFFYDNDALIKYMQ